MNRNSGCNYDSLELFLFCDPGGLIVFCDASGILQRYQTYILVISSLCIDNNLSSFAFLFCSQCIPINLLLLGVVAMAAIGAILVSIALTRVSVNSKQASCSKARTFIITEGKSATTDAFRPVPYLPIQI